MRTGKSRRALISSSINAGHLCHTRFHFRRNWRYLAEPLRFTITSQAMLPKAAKIDILNQTPLSMEINDVLIRDTKTLKVIDGTPTALQPGHVYVNGERRSTEDVTSDTQKNIQIIQDAFSITLTISQRHSRAMLLR